MRVFIIFLFSFIISLTGRGQILINEFLSSNVNGLLDSDGEYVDWIEIYNAGTETVNLMDYALTDDSTIPDKWTFPALDLGSSQYLVVHASGKDRKIVDLTYNTIIDRGDDWKYLVPSSDIGTSWHSIGYDDSSWETGPSGFGYSDDDDATVIAATLSIFIRKEFTVSDPASVRSIVLHIDYDDAFVAYINGVEIARGNLGTPGSNVPYDQVSDGDHEARIYQGMDPEIFQVYDVEDLLLEGTNVIAIQGHNRAISSSDMSLIPILTLGTSGGVQNISPYISLPPGGGLHTNFKIDSDGETLFLYDAGGVLIDQADSTLLPSDISYGRKPDGSGNWKYFFEPTPGGPNITEGATLGIANTVEFSVEGGKHLGGTSINLTTTDPNDTIYYTTDGSIPDRGSIRYTSPVTINGDRVIRARVIRTGALPGPVSTNTYITRYNHQIPVVCISTPPENLWDDDIGIYVLGPDYEAASPHYGANYWEEWERPVHFELYETNGNKVIDQGAGIKIMGGWTRMAEQKSVALFARNDYGKGEFDYKFFADKPIEEFEAIVLRNSGNDNMQLQYHDCFMTGLTRNMNIDRQAFRPAAVYLNGEYWGVQNIREKINEHFIAENHGVNPDSVNLLEFQSSIIDGTNQEYLEILSFLNGHASLQNTSDYQWVRDQIDLDNFIQYQLTQIYLNNTDWPGNNIKFWNTSNGKPWRWILYDTDFGFQPGAYGNNTLEFALATNGPDWPNPPWATLFLRRMVSNLEFRYNFVNQYCDRLNTDFRPARVSHDLDSLREIYYADMEYHFDRWWGSYGEWEDRISGRKSFGTYRPSRCRLHMQEEFSLGNEMGVTLDVNDEAAGKILLNTVFPPEYPFNGIYFEDVPIRLTALPKPGYKFINWEGTINSTDPVIDYNMAEPGTFVANFTEASAEDISIVINEINYSSSDTWDTGDWIELFNNGNTAVDFEGWLISDTGIDTGHYFQSGIVLYPGDYLVVCRNLVDFRNYNPSVTNSVGNIPFGLSSSGDMIRLYDANENLIDAVDYYPFAPWPENAVGTGSTIELKDPALDNTKGENWQAIGIGGTPGRANQGIVDIEDFTVPELFTRFDAFPNPFTDFTTVQFTVKEEGRYRLEVFDMKGQLLEILADDYLLPDTYSMDWYGQTGTDGAVSGGIYMLRLSSGNTIETLKLIMIK